MSSTPELLYRGLSHAPLEVVRALAGRNLIVLAYHVVSDEDLPHVKHLYPYRNVKQFTVDLEFLLADFQPVTLAEVLNHLNAGSRFAQPSCLLTFDDGLRQVHDVVAPLLRAKGVPATFFLITDFLDNHKLGWFCKRSLLGNSTLGYGDESKMNRLAEQAGVDFDDFLKRQRPFLDSDQVRALLAQGFTIGAHSLDHPVYEDISLAEQLRQTRESVRFLQERFGIDYRVFAFPHHDRGVSRQFFEEVNLDATFGTAGLSKNPHPRHLQRLPMEYKNLPAKERVHEALTETAAARLTGRRA